MPNIANLKPARTKSEARERGKKGGIASGESRREKKILRTALEVALSMPSEEIPDQTNLEAIVAGIIKKACRGDVYAFVTIRDTIGEKPTGEEKAEENGAQGILSSIFEALRKPDVKSDMSQ